jgi:predicted nucleic acid-binding protein
VKLVDTSVAIDHLRGVGPATELLHRLTLEDEQLAASEVVRFELLGGVRDAEMEFLEVFFSTLSWVPVNEEVSRVAGNLARQHRRAHGGIRLADYVIAATTLILGAELLTLNVRHFPMLAGLRAAY